MELPTKEEVDQVGVTCTLLGISWTLYKRDCEWRRNDPNDVCIARYTADGGGYPSCYFGGCVVYDNVAEEWLEE